MFNLDETGFTPGRDLTGKIHHRVVTTAMRRAIWSKVNYKYSKRVTLIRCINAAWERFLPIFVLTGVREPQATDGSTPTPVTHIIPQGWLCCWRRDVGSVERQEFKNWAREFVSAICQRPS